LKGRLIWFFGAAKRSDTYSVSNTRFTLQIKILLIHKKEVH